MNFKPSDFFISIIDFFGIIIPGAVLFFFHGELLMNLLGVDVYSMNSANYWILLLFASYIMGHFLLGGSVPMGKIAIRYLDPVTLDYFDEVKKMVILPSGNSERKKNRKNDAQQKNENERKEIAKVFYAAFSYLRLNSPAAMAELEKQAAEYKLFRSLSLFLIIDIILVSLDLACNISPASSSFWRLGLSGAFLALTYWRFDFLFDWTYRLAFDFYLQTQKTKEERPKN